MKFVWDDKKAKLNFKMKEKIIKAKSKKWPAAKCGPNMIFPTRCGENTTSALCKIAMW